MPDIIRLERDESLLEPDRFGDHPHPREMLFLAGHDEPEQALLEAYRSGKLHHAWLLCGPEGVGKATLAYRFARFIFAHPDPAHASVQNARDLAVGADHPVAGQVARQSYPDLAVIRRSLVKSGKSLSSDIAVDDVRDGLSILRVTAGAGGWRVIIVDAADDLNRASANALLKLLEEPPARVLFLLIAHRPGVLLPTIRSRCRALRVAALEISEVSDVLKRLSDATPSLIADAAEQSEGSPRQALALLDPIHAALRRDMAKLLRSLPSQDHKATMLLVDKATGKPGQANFEIILAMLESHLRSTIHLGLSARKPAAVLAAQAELWDKLRRSARDVEAYNLDRRPLLLSIFSELADIERRA